MPYSYRLIFAIITFSLWLTSCQFSRLPATPTPEIIIKKVQVSDVTVFPTKEKTEIDKDKAKQWFPIELIENETPVFTMEKNPALGFDYYITMFADGTVELSNGKS